MMMLRRRVTCPERGQYLTRRSDMSNFTDKPLCQCHGEPQRWRSKSGRWECRVAHRIREEKLRRAKGQSAQGSREWQLKIIEAAKRGEENGRWFGDNVGYRGAHYRHKQNLANNPCALLDDSCKGRLELALKNNVEPVNIRTDPTTGRFYSLHSDDYQMLCKSHHRRYDLSGNGPGSYRLPGMKGNK